jgi:hypothetical protein
MSERVAMGIVVAGSLVLATVSFVGLWLLGASVELMGVAWAFILVAAGSAAGFVGVHDGPSGGDRDD